MATSYITLLQGPGARPFASASGAVTLTLGPLSAASYLVVATDDAVGAATCTWNITDSDGGTWTSQRGSGNQSGSVYYRANANTSTSLTITATPTGASGGGAMAAFEFAGVTTATNVGGSAGASGSAPSAPISTSLDNSMVFVAARWATNITRADADYTLWKQHANDLNGAEFKLDVSPIGSYTPNFQNPSTGGGYSSTTVAFSPNRSPINIASSQWTGPLGGTATITPDYQYSPSAFQWQSAPMSSPLYSNVPGTWSNIVGATGSSYTTGTLSASDNGSWYRVLMTNVDGSRYSEPLRVFVTGLPVTGKGNAGAGASKFGGWQARSNQNRTSRNSLIRPRLFPGDLDTSETTIWADWFGTTVSAPAIVANANANILMLLGAGT